MVKWSREWEKPSGGSAIFNEVVREITETVVFEQRWKEHSSERGDERCGGPCGGPSVAGRRPSPAWLQVRTPGSIETG